MVNIYNSVVNKTINGSATKYQSPFVKLFCKRKGSFQLNKACCMLCWFSGPLQKRGNCEWSEHRLATLETIQTLGSVFLAVHSQLPPILSSNCHLKHLSKVSYMKYFNKIFIENHTMDITDNTTASGFFIEISKPMESDNHSSFGNLHKCSHELYISGISIDNGVVDCPSDSSDESDYNDFRSRKGGCSPLYQKSNQSESGQTCNHYMGITNSKPGQVMEKFTCKSGKEIDTQLVNDLISDCGTDAEDEQVYKTILLFGAQHKCDNTTHIPCITGHNRCYNSDDICVYKLDESMKLIPCRNGGHMQECQNFTCNAKYKCPNSYCLSFISLCDGMWDCLNGEDEMASHQCSSDRKCAGMFLCKNSKICVHLRDICDNEINCPRKDDEFLCILHEVACPIFCSCLYFAVSCENVLQCTDLFFTSPYLSIHMNNMTIANVHFLDLWVKAITVILVNNTLHHFCNVISNHSSLKTLHIRHNPLCSLNTSCFHNISLLWSLDHSYNKISMIQHKAFSNLPSIHCLIL